MSVRLGKSRMHTTSSIHPPSRVRMGIKLKIARPREQTKKKSANRAPPNKPHTQNPEARLAAAPEAYTHICPKASTETAPARISAPNKVISISLTGTPNISITKRCPNSWHTAARTGTNERKLQSSTKSNTKNIAVGARIFIFGNIFTVQDQLLWAARYRKQTIAQAGPIPQPFHPL